MSKIVKGGQNTYGEIIGIITNNKLKARIPGDIGNANTFNFPVRYKVVREACTLSYLKGDPELLNPFIKAAQELEKNGAKAITSSCGFLILYQKAIANAVNIPVFTSSLLILPLLTEMINEKYKIGIITAHSILLDKRCFEAIGIKSTNRLVIKGMEEKAEFKRVILDDDLFLNVEKLCNEVLEVATNMILENPEIKVVLLECTNLVPFSKAIQQAINLPVFDIVTLTNLIYSAFVKKEFNLLGFNSPQLCCGQ